MARGHSFDLILADTELFSQDVLRKQQPGISLVTYKGTQMCHAADTCTADFVSTSRTQVLPSSSCWGSARASTRLLRGTRSRRA